MYFNRYRLGGLLLGLLVVMKYNFYLLRSVLYGKKRLLEPLRRDMGSKKVLYG